MLKLYWKLDWIVVNVRPLAFLLLSGINVLRSMKRKICHLSMSTVCLKNEIADFAIKLNVVPLARLSNLSIADTRKQTGKYSMMVVRV